MRPPVPTTRPLVVGLLHARGPATVLGRVWAIVVDAVQRMSGWARSHVGQEQIEALPAWTNHNAAATIIRIRRISWIATPLAHLLPSVELGMVVQAVDGQARRCLFQLEAVTAQRLPVAQVFAGHDSLCAAVAPTAPQGLAWSPGVIAASWTAFQDSPATKSLSSDVDRAGHAYQFYHRELRRRLMALGYLGPPARWRSNSTAPAVPYVP